MFAVFSALSVGLSIRETSRSRHRAIVVEIAGRQRTLAERYVRETILAKAGAQADPATTGSLLHASADSLIDGGLAPAVNGDDDETAGAGGDGPRAAPADPGAAAGERSHGHRQRVACEPPDRFGQAQREREGHHRSRAAARRACRADLERLAECRTDDCERRRQGHLGAHPDAGPARDRRPVRSTAAGPRPDGGDAPPDCALPQSRLRLDRSRPGLRRGRVPLRQPGGRAHGRRAGAGASRGRLRGDHSSRGPRARWPARASRACRARSSSAYATAWASGGTSRRM